jgi:hypothetical protein
MLRLKQEDELMDEREIKSVIESIALKAGWDSFTLILLLSRWLSETNRHKELIDYLEALAMDEDDEQKGQ